MGYRSAAGLPNPLDDQQCMKCATSSRGPQCEIGYELGDDWLQNFARIASAAGELADRCGGGRWGGGWGEIMGRPRPAERAAVAGGPPRAGARGPRPCSPQNEPPRLGFPRG